MLVGVLSSPSIALAHAEPAYAPLFDAGPCITRVDRETQPKLHMGYVIPGDDNVLTTGDIPLTDALSHQFFALRGAIVMRGFTPTLYSTESPDEQSIAMPLWITPGDVERAQQSSDAERLGYDLSVVDSGAVLDTIAPLRARTLRITGDDARVPITLVQAARGVDWDVSLVPAGLYTVGGYVFSPPFNGWQFRPGLVKIVDRSRDTPAAVLDRVQEALFGVQGRRVRACIDAPEGTRLRGFVRMGELAHKDWVPWLDEQPVASGRFEACYRRPDPMLGGPVSVRIDLVAPDGRTSTFYSPDTFQLLPGNSACVNSDTICCPEPEPSAADAGSGSCASGDCDAGSDGGGDAAPAEAGAEAEPQARTDDGCGVLAAGRPAARGGAGSLWLAVATLIGLVGLRRRRNDGESRPR